MSKKISSEELAENALSENPRPVEVKITSLRVGFISHNPYFDVSAPVKLVAYPPNITDQLNNHSIAEMVRQGQGTVAEEKLENFEFPDGKDDGSLQGHSMNELEWADPAERYEHEVAVNAEISTAIRREANAKMAVIQAEKSAEKPAEKPAEKSAEKAVSE